MSRKIQPTTQEDDLETDWALLRGASIRRRVIKEVPPPDLDKLLRQLRSPLLVVPGASTPARTGIYNALQRQVSPNVIIEYAEPRAWLQMAPIEDWTLRVSRLRVPDDNAPKGFPSYPSWELLWALASIEDFIIEEPLLSMADQRTYLVHDAIRLFFAFRFLVREGANLEASKVLQTLTRWITMAPLETADIEILTRAGLRRRLGSIAERIDMLVLFLTLCAQNGLVDKTHFVFDSLEDACHNQDRPRLRELHQIVTGVARWSASMDTALGIVLGINPKRMPQLRRTNEKLATEVAIALA